MFYVKTRRSFEIWLLVFAILEEKRVKRIL